MLNPPEFVEVSCGPRPDRTFVHHIIEAITQFVAAHAWLGYLTVFLAALLEAVPVLGTFIPGTTLILALSALIPAGDLKLVPVLTAAISGAILGDGAAYWIGHVRQRDILQIWPLKNYPGVIAQSEAFFARFGALAVFLARFVPPIRAFVPVTAGALGMPPAKFYPANIPAAIIWAPAHVLPAVFAVTLLEHVGGLAGLEHKARHYSVLAVVVLAIIAGGAVWWWCRRNASQDLQRSGNQKSTL
jgi:membrane protein DedA with SNARE-associated domain